MHLIQGCTEEESTNLSSGCSPSPEPSVYTCTLTRCRRWLWRIKGVRSAAVYFLLLFAFWCGVIVPFRTCELPVVGLCVDMSSGGKSSKMMNYINYRMRVTVQDSRCLIGTFMAFDKHMNLVLGDCEEIRVIKSRGKKERREERRTLGLVLLRGENIVSLAVEGPPVKSKRAGAGLKKTPGGPGVAREISRGLPPPMAMGAPPPMMAAPPGLGGYPGQGMPPGMPNMRMPNMGMPMQPGPPGMMAMPPNMHQPPLMGGGPPPMGGPPGYPPPYGYPPQ